MKKIATILLVCCLNLVNATTDFEKTFTMGFEIATNPQNNPFNDAAHALSDLWQLHNSYTFDMFANEQIEWQKLSVNSMEDFREGAAIVNTNTRELFLYLSMVSDTQIRHLALNLSTFKISLFDSDQIKDLLWIYPKEIPMTKFVSTTTTRSSRIVNGKLNMDIVLKSSKDERIHNYPLGIFLLDDLDIQVQTQDAQKNQKQFSGFKKSGEVIMDFDANAGDINLKAQSTTNKFVYVFIFRLNVMNIDMGH
ncbi:hypothetical protein [Candidatus Uabimicrobium amorphum]|uniref:Uncharacterized protein n=2 Tax=Uabimicrobium amorphum TaxID=2596890 RepID=A0A5S9IP26_UABAM|nr:hypothetical protein [Candidatus Uabimicrobium amorphum]BBM84570.1 hypothetical protein UABAM_02931 [Candidatus Uabimicrobium amorphum]